MEHTDFIRSRWDKTWESLGKLPPEGVLDRLLARYGEVHRAYHTLQHLTECFMLRDHLGTACSLPAEVDLALFFHDAVYEPMRSDNEKQSAAWLDSIATCAGVATIARERLRALVMVTRHDGQPSTVDEAVLVDTDLGILGASDERFDEYDRQVRQEYRRVLMVLYRRKRREILESFLDRETIYFSDAYRDALETQARANLTRAIARLR